MTEPNVCLIQIHELPDLAADPSWEKVLIPGQDRNLNAGPSRKSGPLKNTLRALQKTPNGRFIAHTGNVGRGLYQGRKALTSSPMHEREGGPALWNSDANRVRALIRDGIIEVWKKPNIDKINGPAVMFVATEKAWSLLKDVPSEPDGRPNPVRLETGREFTNQMVDELHDNFLPVGPTYRAMRDKEGNWDPVTASWEVYEGLGPGGMPKQLRVIRRAPITPRAPLTAYIEVDAGDIAKVLAEMTDHPDPKDRGDIAECVRFLDDLDKRAVMGWLQDQAHDAERRNEAVEELMFSNLSKEELIPEAIELIWPGRSNGKHRRNAMESVRLLVADILIHLIQRKAAMVLLAGPMQAPDDNA